MFLPDAPIKFKKDDQLNRSHFVERFGKALMEWRDEEGIVIGLYGSWGSGKRKNPTFKTLNKIVKILNVSLPQIIQ